MLRPDLQRIVDDLSRAEHGELTLDALGEALGARQVSSEEIGDMIDALESAGVRILDAPLGARESLARVLDAARDLRALGRAASPREIAAHSGLALESVKLALLYAQTLTR